MTTTNQSPLLATMLNMTAFHRGAREVLRGITPGTAVVLQQRSRTLLALADRWMATSAVSRTMPGPYEGAPDLNAPAALQLDGVLFMEGEGEPREIKHLNHDLRMFAEDSIATGHVAGHGPCVLRGSSPLPSSTSTSSPTCSVSATG